MKKLWITLIISLLELLAIFLYATDRFPSNHYTVITKYSTNFNLYDYSVFNNQGINHPLNAGSILSLYPQDTTTQEFLKLYRVNKPFYVFGGLDGFGAGVTMFGFADFQIGIPFFKHIVKIKLFLPNRNSSPYIGYGFGKQYEDLNDRDPNKWQVVIVGWHFYPFGKRKFYEFSLQYPLYEENKKAFYPTVISFSVGVRIF